MTFGSAVTVDGVKIIFKRRGNVNEKQRLYQIVLLKFDEKMLR